MIFPSFGLRKNISLIVCLSLAFSAYACDDSTPVAVSPAPSVPNTDTSGLREVFVPDVFDETFYLETNPEVSSLVASGQFASSFDHYQQVGRPEGRQPSGYFNESFYLSNYPDVAAAVNSGQFIDGLDHFLQEGQFERRAPSELIDPDWLIRYFQTTDPSVASQMQSGSIVVAKYFITRPIGYQYQLTAERAFLTLWNDRDFETIEALTTGAEFRDNNEFTVLPGRHDGNRPGTVIGSVASGGEPGLEGLKQTAQLFLDLSPDLFLEQKEFAVDGNKLFIRWEQNLTQTEQFGLGYEVAPGVTLATALGVRPLNEPTPRRFQGLIVAFFNSEGKMYERSGFPIGHETTANFLQMGVPLGPTISNLIQPVFPDSLNIRVEGTYPDFGRSFVD